MPSTSPRSVAAFHLDKLAEAGLVEVTFQRTSGRTGPGAGRPAKLYRRGPGGVGVGADRRYDLAGAAVGDGHRRRGAHRRTDRRECLSASARTAGRAIGEDATAASGPVATSDERRLAVLDLLRLHGYEAHARRGRRDRVGQLPFHRLAESTAPRVRHEPLPRRTARRRGPRDARRPPSREPGYCCVRIGAAWRRRAGRPEHALWTNRRSHDDVEDPSDRRRRRPDVGRASVDDRRRPLHPLLDPDFWRLHCTTGWPGSPTLQGRKGRSCTSATTTR